MINDSNASYDAIDEIFDNTNSKLQSTNHAPLSMAEAVNHSELTNRHESIKNGPTTAHTPND